MIKRTLKWTVKARLRIKESAEYIEQDNHVIADKFVKHVEKKAQTLLDFPYIGCKGRVSGTREFLVSNFPYFIVYMIKENQIEIVDILPTRIQYPYKS